VDPLDITRTSQNHRLSWRLGPVTPSGSFLSRRWEDARIPTGRAGGFRYEETGAGLAAAPGAPLDWRVDFKRGLADSLVAGDWQLQRDSRTFNGGISTGRYAGMRLVGEGTLRRILSPGQAEQTTRLARLDLSGQWDRIGSDWSLGYRVDNSRTQVLDRQVVFVGENQGDYNQDGDFVGNNLGSHRQPGGHYRGARRPELAAGFQVSWGKELVWILEQPDRGSHRGEKHH
jgi:hypothetical protein